MITSVSGSINCSVLKNYRSKNTQNPSIYGSKNCQNGRQVSFGWFDIFISLMSYQLHKSSVELGIAFYSLCFLNAFTKSLVYLKPFQNRIRNICLLPMLFLHNYIHETPPNNLIPMDTMFSIVIVPMACLTLKMYFLGCQTLTGVIKLLQ